MAEEIAGLCARAPQLKNNNNVLMTKRYDMSLVPDPEKTPRFYRSVILTNMNDIHAISSHAPKAHRFAIIPALRHGLTE
ncbi:hypothetical protein D3C81_2071170 [compost metagenome]